jgi:uncharacterized HAD superfamily protein
MTKPTKTNVDVNSIALEGLLGNTIETRIFDLIIPLKEGTVFTEKQVLKALRSTKGAGEINTIKINLILKTMTNEWLIKEIPAHPGTYVVNEHSKRIWAIKNLLVSIYLERAHYNAMKRLGIK